MSTFRPASTSLDHTLVVCDLIQINNIKQCDNNDCNDDVNKSDNNNNNGGDSDYN